MTPNQQRHRHVERVLDEKTVELIRIGFLSRRVWSDILGISVRTIALVRNGQRGPGRSSKWGGARHKHQPTE